MQEKELIEKCKKGDEEAFSTLMHLHEGKIFQVCLQIIKDEEIAQDLTQEAFVHAFQHLDSFKMHSTFYTWLYRIAKNLSLNLLRKKHLQEQELKEELTSAPVPQEEEELSQRMQEALEQLPLKQRLVFELFDLQKVPQKEIAAQLNISPGTVRSRLFYARRKMRRLLKP